MISKTTIVMLSIILCGIVYLFAMQYLVEDPTTDLDDARFYVLYFSILLLAVMLSGQRKKSHRKASPVFFQNSVVYAIALAAIILVISLYAASKLGEPLHLRTIKRISFILIPVIYGFVLVNLVSLQKLTSALKWLLVLVACFYVVEIGSRILLNNASLEMSFFESKSPFESNYCSDLFIWLFVYFNCVKHFAADANERRRVDVPYWVSFVFAILSWKRLGILFVLFLFIATKFWNFRGTVSKNLQLATIIFFTLTTVLYTSLLSGELSSSIDWAAFTMSRSDFLKFVIQSGEFSWGYGFSDAIVGAIMSRPDKTMEMDLVQIYTDVGIVPLFLFIFCYVKSAGRNFYSYTAIIYLLVFLTLASITHMIFAFCLVMIVVMAISRYALEGDLVLSRSSVERRRIIDLHPT